MDKFKHHEPFQASRCYWSSDALRQCRWWKYWIEYLYFQRGQLIKKAETMSLTNISQAPTYPLGFGFSVGATVLGAMIPATVHWYLMRKENKRRDGLDVDEIERTYTTEELGEMGENSPLFRFVL